MAENTQVPQGPTLESAGRAIEGLLTASETPVKAKTPAEPAETEQEAEVPEPEEEEGALPKPEESEDEDADEEELPKPKGFKVKVAGQEVEVTEDELKSGYSRTADYTRKTQDLADARKAFEDKEVTAVRAERQQYAQRLADVDAALKELTPTEPDWAALQRSLPPDQFTAQLLEFQQTQKAREAIAAEREKVGRLQYADAQASMTKFVADQTARLPELIPTWKDPEVAKTERGALREFGRVQGFSEDELNAVTDARVVALLHKAYSFDKAEKAKPKVQEKIAAALRTSTPGALQAPRKGHARKEAMAKLAKSGRIEDAAAAIEHLL
jgi:chaperonin cofactor prefoldin